MTTDSLLATFDDAGLIAAERRAWRESARCWAEYHAAVAAEPPIGHRDHGNARAFSQLMHDSAWAAHNTWVAMHDERMRRGLSIESADR